MSTELTHYRDLLADIKVRVRTAQHKAALSANAEMILMYWDIGRMIAARQEREGWGAGVIPRLAVDLKNELPEEKGFSETNLKRMVQFSREYPSLGEIGARAAPQLTDPGADGLNRALPAPQMIPSAMVPQPAAPLPLPPNIIFGIPWFHHVILIHKPIGVADYELTRALPEEFASSLPSIEAIEEELSRDLEMEEPS